MDDLIRKLQSRIAIRGLEIKENWKYYDQYRTHSELGWVYKSYALEYGELQALDKQLLRRLFRDRYMIRNMSKQIDKLQQCFLITTKEKYEFNGQIKEKHDNQSI